MPGGSDPTLDLSDAAMNAPQPTADRGGFTVRVDDVGKDEWHEIIGRFRDASIYQSWSYGAIRWGESSLSPFVLERDGAVVGAALVVIKALPVVGLGMAHVRFGPLWQRDDIEPDPAVLTALLEALRVEYTERRRLFLRVKPWVPEPEPTTTALADASFTQNTDMELYESFVLDLRHEIGEIHDGMERKWRRDLRRGREAGVVAERVEGVEGIDAVVELYHEMVARKGFADLTDIDLLREYYLDLPAELRPRVMLVRHEGEVLSGICYSVIGDRAFALFGVNSPRSLELHASFVVNFAVVEELVAEGTCRWYDLVGGLSDPGIRRFKAGLAKGCGTEIQMGDYEAEAGAASRFVVGIGDRVRAGYATTRHRIADWRAQSASGRAST